MLKMSIVHLYFVVPNNKILPTIERIFIYRSTFEIVKRTSFLRQLTEWIKNKDRKVLLISYYFF